MSTERPLPPMPQKAAEEEIEIHLRDYLQVLLRHRWLILAVFMLTTLAVAVYSLTATPVFQSTAKIIIEPRVPKALSLEDLYSSDISSREYFQSQIEIIKSRPVAKMVMDELNLAHSPEFSPKKQDGLLAGWRAGMVATLGEWENSLSALFRGEDAALEEQLVKAEVKEKSLYQAFQGRLEIEPVRNTQLVHIRFSAQDPELAARVAQSVTENFIRFDLQNKIDAAQQAAGWLNQRLDEARQKVEEAERQLQGYKEDNEIITGFSGENEKLTAQTLSDINKQLTETKAARVEAEVRFQHAARLGSNFKDLETIPTLLSNPTISIIRQQEVEISVELAELSKVYGAKHPKIVALQAKLQDLHEKKKAEIQKTINSLKSEYEVVLAREQSLQGSLTEIKQTAQHLNRKAVDFGVLHREVESARNMYEILLRRFKETSLSAHIATGNIRVVENAILPEYPVKPKKKRNVLLAAVLGLMLGGMIAFFLEYLDNTVKTPDDIKRFGIPYLAPVPLFELDIRQPFPELIAHHSSKSAASEAYRSLRTSLLFSSAEQPPQVLLISSPGPGEGKSITSANLAVTMAQTGSRTLVIDCDLRRPKIHKYFKLSREQGMSNILTGAENIDDFILPTEIPNLSVIPSGPVPPNPSELLGAKRMSQMLALLRQRYDRIIIDSPPVSAVTDASVLTGVADGVVLVVRSEATVRNQMESALEILRPLSVKNFGAVLNGVDMSKNRYYNYHYYYYYYGEEGDLGRKKDRRKKERRGQAAPGNHEPSE